MNKISFTSLAVALGISNILISSDVNNLKLDLTSTVYEKEFKEKEDIYSLSELELMSVSDDLGNMHYYFVKHTDTGKYQSITNPEIMYEDSIPNLEMYYWVPDYTRPISVMNAQDFLTMNKYIINQSYTKEELQALENTFSTFLYNPFLWVKDETFSIHDLFMIGNEEHISIYDANYYVRVEETNQKEKRTVLYYYNLTNFKQALKCNYGITLEEEQQLRSQMDYSYLEHIEIEKETSLYRKNNYNVQYFIYDLSDYLTTAQKDRGFLYYSEIEEIVKSVNSKKEQVWLLALEK